MFSKWSIRWMLIFVNCYGSVFAAANTVANELRDPTMPYHFNEKTQQMVAKSSSIADSNDLQMIYVSPVAKYAIIHGDFVAVGDKVGNKVITSINENSVILQDKGGDSTLYLSPTILQPGGNSN